MSGVSVRTLHHYDKIGLLSPYRHDNGYRYYSEKDMSILQTILFYKYLGFSLHQIKELITSGDTDMVVHLKTQLDLMQRQKEKLLTLIETLEKTIESEERRNVMSTKEKFVGFTYQDNQKYIKAAMDEYGKEGIEEALEKQKGSEKEVVEGFNKIFFSFAENRKKGIIATSDENVVLSKELHRHICRYAFDCSKDIFSKIGYGYVKNKEFKNNIDQFGEGTAQYVCDAIQNYVSL